MSALSAFQPSPTFASRPYLEQLLGQPPRVPKSTPTDPAAAEFFAEVGERIRAAREQKGWRREDLAHHVTNKWSVVVVNVLLGWTLVGWVIALAMSARTQTQKQPV